MRAIDLFAGAGGFSSGAVQAGCQVVWAANHWQAAVVVHKSNHPLTTHICQDLHQANWAEVPPHDLLLASPCCQGHSRARGKKNGNPQHDASRSTAWAVVSAVEFHQPPFVIVENVPDFLRWNLYPAWKMAIETLGYSITHITLDAADYGVPQNRDRLFIVATKSAAPIQLNLIKKDPVAISNVLDFNSGNWTKISKPGRAKATLNRIKNGRNAYGKQFVMPYYGSGSGLTGRSLARPIGTITTRDRWALVNNNKMRMLTTAEYCAAMGFEKNYILPSDRRQAIEMLGNAVCPPVAHELISALMRVA